MKTENDLREARPLCLCKQCGKATVILDVGDDELSVCYDCRAFDVFGSACVFTIGRGSDGQPVFGEKEMTMSDAEIEKTIKNGWLLNGYEYLGGEPYWSDLPNRPFFTQQDEEYFRSWLSKPPQAG